ncbi:MAG: hypothetical protein HYV35_07860 [Lentisphaerae bacterium]|nr:hypothetical protein [Lentisphaerota bacterium]
MNAIAKETTPRKLLIGWSGRDITPPKPVNVVGQLHARVTDQVLDPLTVTALALSDDSGREAALMVSADIAVIEEQVYDECRKILKERLVGFNTDWLVLNATHTHNAPAQVPLVRYPPQPEPVMPVEVYTQLLVQGICDAAVEAWATRQPGAVGWGCGQAVVGCNRRVVYLDGAARMYGNTQDANFSHIEGYEDHGVDILCAYDCRGQLTGLIVNLACPSQVSEALACVTADFWHDARTEIRRRHGSALYVLPQCSAAGDQSPHPLLKKQAAARMLVLKGLMQHGQDTRAAERVEIGRRIAAAVDEVLPPAAQDKQSAVIFQHRVARLELPRRMITPEELAFARQTVETHKARLAAGNQDPASREYSSSYVHIRRFQNVIERYERQGAVPTLPIEVHVIRLGDIAIATNRFEYFLDYGLRIKARSKAVQTFVVQLAGEGSYLPTERALQSKSYGATIENNLVTPAGGQILVNETVRLINAMFA